MGAKRPPDAERFGPPAPREGLAEVIDRAEALAKSIPRGADGMIARQLLRCFCDLFHLLEAESEDLGKALVAGRRAGEIGLGQARARGWQQRGNDKRRVVQDGFVEEADDRQRAGATWEDIARDYSISPSRLRHLVYAARRKK